MHLLRNSRPEFLKTKFKFMQIQHYMEFQEQTLNSKIFWRAEYATTTYPTSSPYSGSVDGSVPAIVDVSKNTQKILYDNGEYPSAYNSTTAKTFTTPHSMPLMGAYSGGTQDYRDCKLYYALFFNNGTLVRHFIPCRRESDNKLGLYDLCESTCQLTNSPFYIDAGNGTGFLSGGNVYA